MKKFILGIIILSLMACGNQEKVESKSGSEKRDSIYSQQGIKAEALEAINDENMILNLSEDAFIEVKKDESGNIIEVTNRNVSFNQASITHNNQLTFTFAKRTNNITYQLGAEGQHSVISIDFYDQLSGEKIKSIKEEADDLSIETDYYIGELYGCCGDENKYFIKNMDSGQKLIEYNREYYKIESVNSKKIYFIGIKPAERFHENEKHESNKGLIIASIYFADINGKINKVVLHAKDELTYQKISHWAPELHFNSKGRDKYINNVYRYFGGSSNPDNIEFKIRIDNESDGSHIDLLYTIKNGYINGNKNPVIHDTIAF